jgi:hypothetical protein
MEYEYKKWSLRKIKASASRVRNNLLEVKKIATLMRKEIQDEVRNMPVRSKPIKIPKPSKPTALERQTSASPPSVESDAL